ncbi:MAG: IS701 family transposase [Streptosporangiaceae bacterium]
MANKKTKTAAGARIGAELGKRKRDELLGRLGPHFARVEAFLQARAYVLAVMSGLLSRNGWSIAEFIGDKTPDKTQRLLNRASWDTPAAMSDVRRFAVEGLDEAAAKRRRRRGRIRVGALDETGQEKKGESTAGVKRQHMGCADGVANGINTVHLSYVREKVGHALIGFRQWIPEEQVKDVRAVLRMALPLTLKFLTKGELAIEILREACADGIFFDFICGDEVYGSCTRLREYLESVRQAYVLRVRKNFYLTFRGGSVLTCEDAVKKMLRPGNWEVRSAGRGTKGERWYAWAWIQVDDRHCLLVRRHLKGGDLAFHYCYLPAGQRVAMSRLVRAAGLRWPVEEGFEFSKDCFGLDQSQVRLYHAIARHTVLVMAALAVCAVTAALLGDRTDTQTERPTSPDQSAPADCGLVPLSVPEIGRLLASHPPYCSGHAEHWSEFRRRHQARACWYHQRARLARSYEMSQAS